MTTRRDLLRGMGAGLAAAALPRIARGNPFTNTCSYNVLQIFLYRGLSHRDTLWVDEDAKGWAPDRLEPDMSAVTGAAGAVSTPFVNEEDIVSLDHDIRFGPGFHPLVAAGALDRTRLVAMSADLPVHFLSSAVALTGAPLGRPTASSLGARIQSAAGPTPLPVSWVLDGGGLGRITRLATTTGTLGASNRPFVIPVGNNAVVDRMNRLGWDAGDPLVDLYRDRYAQTLTHKDGPVRAADFDVYSDSVNRMLDWQSVHGLLDGGPDLTATAASFHDNRLTKGVEFGAYLLDTGAKHVCVIGGNGGSPDLDTHGSFPGPDYVGHATRHNGVLWGVCEQLRIAIQAGQINLDTTIIQIFSEFGRYLDGNNGSEHRVQGFAELLIGGPIDSRDVVGRLDFTSSNRGVAATGSATHIEVHDALSIAAGVDADDIGVANGTALASKILGTTCSIGLEQG